MVIEKTRIYAAFRVLQLSNIIGGREDWRTIDLLWWE